MREFDQGTIPGSDVQMDGYTEYEPLPKANFGNLTDPSGGWLPKTDWSRDRIIANDD